jgi:hypothetical protein
MNALRMRWEGDESEVGVTLCCSDLLHDFLQLPAAAVAL